MDLSYFDLAHLDKLMLSAGFCPLKQSEIPENVDVGLRPDGYIFSRLKNSIASICRAIAYIIKGEASPSVNRRFYRLVS